MGHARSLAIVSLSPFIMNSQLFESFQARFLRVGEFMPKFHRPPEVPLPPRELGGLVPGSAIDRLRKSRAQTPFVRAASLGVFTAEIQEPRNPIELECFSLAMFGLGQCLKDASRECGQPSQVHPIVMKHLNGSPSQELKIELGNAG